MLTSLDVQMDKQIEDFDMQASQSLILEWLSSIQRGRKNYAYLLCKTVNHIYILKDLDDFFRLHV